MKDVESNQGNGESKGPTVLVAVDLSHCSRLALKKEERMKKISFQKFEHMILPRFRL